jgi:HK97 family phage major capsid protein
MNFQQDISRFQQKRNEATERQTVLMKAASDEGRTLDAEEQSEFDGLSTEIKHIDDHLARLKRLVGDNSEPKSEIKGKGPTILVRKTDKEDEFQGQSFVRKLIAKTLAQLSGYELRASDIAEKRWGRTNPTLVNVIKAGVTGGTAYGDGSDSWGAELVSADSRYMGDFVEFLRSQTVFDRLPLREVPANVSIKGQEAIASGYWVGESLAIPASAQDFSDVELTAKKVGAISVASRELLRYSSPAAEMLIRDGLVEASRQRIDQTFLGTGAVSSSAPAGILNGVSGETASGTDAEALRTDIATLYGTFLTAKNATGLHFVCTPTLAKSISLMRNALGQREFPELTAMGGTLEGDPVVTGDNVGATHLILLKPSDIWRIGDMGVEVSLSMDATIEMDDAPAGDGGTPTAGTANPVSMFQTENVAFKVVRPINFAKRRSHAAQYVSDAAYAGGS